METTTFDEITRTLSSTLPRRTALRGLVAGAVAAVAGGVLLQTEDTAAKRRKKGKKSKKQQNRQQNQDQNQNGGQTSLPAVWSTLPKRWPVRQRPESDL